MKVWDAKGGLVHLLLSYSSPVQKFLVPELQLQQNSLMEQFLELQE